MGVDEAAAQVRVQLDSRPEKIDVLERKVVQLEIESTALSREKDKASKKRRKEVHDEIANLREELEPLNQKWEADRGRAEELKNAKEKLTRLEAKVASAERVGDYEKAADLKYGAIPDLKAHIETIVREEEKRKADQAEKMGGCEDEDSLALEVVLPKHIADIISRWTGIPANKLTQTERERILKLGDRLKERVVGQEEAVGAVVDSIMRSKAGLARASQPDSSFLFLGPTGTGKTELAKALFSELYDGDERSLVRIDMSEYTEEHSVSRLIGAPPGYVGHEEGGQLTEAVRHRPYCVVLFDEVEKAHKQVWNVLLQVLDDGRLTDSQGRVIDFKNVIIVMTSNIGAHHLLRAAKDNNYMMTGEREEEDGDVDMMGESPRKKSKHMVKELVMGEVRQHFRPEFLNRLDDIIIFESLHPRDLCNIVEQQLHLVMRNIKNERQINVTATRAAQERVV